MSQMRTVCDNMRRQTNLRREMSELRNAIADIEQRCRKGSKISTARVEELRRRYEEAAAMADAEIERRKPRTILKEKSSVEGEAAAAAERRKRSLTLQPRQLGRNAGLEQ
jgi:hypothetical protein